MLNILIAIIGIIFTILLIVGVHEFGHFLAARACGIKVLRFSIGFGKSLLSWRDKKGTEFVLAAIPLGGYVKMLDEDEGNVKSEDLHLAYNRQPVYKKMIVVICGPLSNLIFAFFLYWVLFMVGFVTPIPLIGKVTPHSIAEQAGLKPQQEIISVDQRPTPTWLPVVVKILSHTGDKDSIPLEVKDLATAQTSSHSLDLTNWKMSDLNPDPLDSLGIVPYQPVVPAIVGKVVLPQAVLKPGDKILSIDKQHIKDWYDVVKIVLVNPDKTLTFVIERQGEKISLPVYISYKRDLLFKKYGFLGMSPQFEWPKNLLRTNQYGPIDALSYAWHDLEDFVDINLIVLGKMVSGKVSVKSLGGPISIFESAGNAIKQGITAFMGFLAFLSISIGIINILPVPGLDGGHLLFQVIEIIIRRPLSQRLQMLLYRFGLIILFLLITQALVNDISRMM